MNIENNKLNYILLFKMISICLLIILIFIFFDFRIKYLNMDIYTFNLFSFKVNNYIKNENKVISDDKKCIINVTINEMDTVNISEFGSVEIINNFEWAKQEYSNGYTFWSYYKNNLYIIQMYANDENIFKNSCKNNFKLIKKTFSFDE